MSSNSVCPMKAGLLHLISLYGRLTHNRRTPHPLDMRLFYAFCLWPGVREYKTFGK